MDFELIFSTIAQYCGWIITIITLLTLLIPRARKALGNFVKKIIGLDTILTRIDTLSDKVEALDLSVGEIHNKFNMHIKMDDVRAQAQLQEMKIELSKVFTHYIDRGHITLEELTTLELRMKLYEALGGNGVIKKTWEDDVLTLPRVKQ